MKKWNKFLTLLVALLIGIGAFEFYLFATYQMDLVNGLIGLFDLDGSGTAQSAPYRSFTPLESDEIVSENIPEQTKWGTEENNQYVENGEYINYPGIPAFPSKIISANVNQNSGEWTYNHDSSKKEENLEKYSSIMSEHGYSESDMGDGGRMFRKEGEEFGVVVLLTFDNIVVSVWPN